MFENQRKALDAEHAEKLGERWFYVENGYYPFGVGAHRNDPDRGLEEWLTPAKWAAYRAGNLSREKAVEMAVKRGAADLVKTQAGWVLNVSGAFLPNAGLRLKV